MRYYFTLFVFLLAISGTKAQNIVANSSFALHDTCPGGTSQLRRCIGWRPLTKTTPDYFHVCSPDANTRVPANFAGYESSLSGSYVGIYNYSGYASWHEYVATDLPAMVAGSTYKVSIKISLAEKHSRYATEAPSVYFYKNIIPDSLNMSYLVLSPQVTFPSYGIIYDTSWVMLSQTFTADSAFTHLAIGNFKEDFVTVKDSVGGGDANVAYYYIDSVAVERVNGVPQISTIGTATLYPNPVRGTGVLSFNNPDGQNCSLYIFDISGQLVKKEEGITGDSIIINGKTLGSGSYYYKITGSGDLPVFGRMLVE